MNITVETVQHYAKLANLHFGDAECESMAHDLGTILDYVEKIKELDLGDVPATSQVLGNLIPVREDISGPSLPQSAALSNAPDKEAGFFLVPKVIKKH